MSAATLSASAQTIPELPPHINSTLPKRKKVTYRVLAGRHCESVEVGRKNLPGMGGLGSEFDLRRYSKELGAMLDRLNALTTDQLKTMAGNEGIGIEDCGNNKRKIIANIIGEPILKDLMYGIPAPDGTPYMYGDVFESDCEILVMNKPGLPPKFALADDPMGVRYGPGSKVWDPSVETIDQFVARIKTESGEVTDDTPTAAAPVLPTANTSTLAEKYNAMTVQQLKDVCAEEEVNISGCGNDKAKLIAALLGTK